MLRLEMTRCHVQRVVDQTTQEKIIGTPGPDLARQTLEQKKGAESRWETGHKTQNGDCPGLSGHHIIGFTSTDITGITFYNDVFGNVLRSHSMETFY